MTGFVTCATHNADLQETLEQANQYTDDAIANAAPNLKDCTGAAMVKNAFVPTCGQLQEAQADTLAQANQYTDAAILNAAPNLKDCTGAAMVKNATVPTCAQMNDAIQDAVDALDFSPTGAAGGALTGTYPNPGLNSTAVATALALKDCNGTSIGVGAAIATCANLSTGLAGKQDEITGGTAGQVYTVQPDGSYAWSTPSGGGTGTTELADGTTILGVGTSADKFRVARPVPLGGTDGQVLTVQPDGSAAWETPASGGTTEVADGTTILGAGTVADPFAVKNPIADGGTAGQIWTVKPDGTYGWVTPESSSSGTNALSFFLGLL